MTPTLLRPRARVTQTKNKASTQTMVSGFILGVPTANSAYRTLVAKVLDRFNGFLESFGHTQCPDDTCGDLKNVYFVLCEQFSRAGFGCLEFRFSGFRCSGFRCSGFRYSGFRFWAWDVPRAQSKCSSHSAPHILKIYIWRNRLTIHKYFRTDLLAVPPQVVILTESTFWKVYWNITQYNWTQQVNSICKEASWPGELSFQLFSLIRVEPTCVWTFTACF